MDHRKTAALLESSLPCLRALSSFRDIRLFPPRVVAMRETERFDSSFMADSSGARGASPSATACDEVLISVAVVVLVDTLGIIGGRPTRWIRQAAMHAARDERGHTQPHIAKFSTLLGRVRLILQFLQNY